MWAMKLHLLVTCSLYYKNNLLLQFENKLKKITFMQGYKKYLQLQEEQEVVQQIVG